jgi:hypothetical protein
LVGVLIQQIVNQVDTEHVKAGPQSNFPAEGTVIDPDSRHIEQAGWCQSAECVVSQGFIAPHRHEA